MFIKQPKRQRDPDVPGAGQHMVREASGKPGPHQASCGDYIVHALRLRYVDVRRKAFDYISGDDGGAGDDDNVGMSTAPFPNHLKAWREFRHMTQEQLADAVGCSKATIGHLESGARRLSDKWLHPISKVLRTNAGYIIDHDPNDLPTAVLDTWAAIPEKDRAQALRVLESFRKTGTDG